MAARISLNESPVRFTLISPPRTIPLSPTLGSDLTPLPNPDLDIDVDIVPGRFLLALSAGVPVTVFYRYERSKLALAWREWMTKRVMEVGFGCNTRGLDKLAVPLTVPLVFFSRSLPLLLPRVVSSAGRVLSCR